jgi:putative transposase
VYPYLLRGLTIDRPNQVWAADITCNPLGRGSAYLVALMDWRSRRVLARRLSNTMDASLCVEALKEAISLFGLPDIFNTDQGSQCASSDFTEVMLSARVRISMDGKGRCIDKVFVERLWRPVKYEDTLLRAYGDLVEARLGIESFSARVAEYRPSNRSSLAYSSLVDACDRSRPSAASGRTPPRTSTSPA